MEKKDFRRFIDARIEKGLPEQVILQEMKSVVNPGIYSDAELLRAIQERPNSGQRKRYRLVNLAFIALVLATSVWLIFALIMVATGQVPPPDPTLPPAYFIAKIFLPIIVTTYVVGAALKFYRSAYIVAAGVYFMGAPETFRGMLQMWSLDMPVQAKLIETIYPLLMVSVVLLAVYLLKSLWPQMTLLGKPRE